MNITYLEKSKLKKSLSEKKDNSLEFVFLVTGALLEESSIEELLEILEDSVRILKDGGLLFVQGIPEVLPELGVFLDEHLTFKYWFAVESLPIIKNKLPSVHAGVMLFSKGNGRFNVQHVRLPHQHCEACERTLKDWGGKAHLMNPEGYVISDVIKDIPPANNYTQISKPLFDIFMRMMDFSSSKQNSTGNLIDVQPYEIGGLVGPSEALPWFTPKDIAETVGQYVLPNISFLEPEIQRKKTYSIEEFDESNLFNVIHHGDAIEILKKYPDESVDLVFADPPYNLDKDYSAYDDERPERNYIEWCNDWLYEYSRILKPTGSLFVLNLPHWSLHHAHFLNRHLYFQNWIVWDALSEPRGKVMPAHYAMLFYTKSNTDFIFNPSNLPSIDARHYCLRASCVKKRKEEGHDDKATLNDIWWDIHRIKHRRDRDHHPCQLPEPFMSRIIQLATNRGDVVLDAFGGAGTTPITALQLDRQYVAIDMDINYVNIMKDKIAQIQKTGFVVKESVQKANLSVPKKTLQLELRRMAKKLGRLPTPDDVKKQSDYDLEIFLDTFPSWGKALKAAKLEVQTK